MPRITITEHSDTYSFQVRNNQYATIAFPITAIWGPAYVAGDVDNNPDWVHFEAGYKGTTEFTDTFKGPNTYLGQREKSYDYALKLLANGYDILVKRVDGLGKKASIYVNFANASGDDPAIKIVFTAKYAGTYGNALKVIVNFNKTTKLGTVQVFEVTDQSRDVLLEQKDVAFASTVASDLVPLITEAEFKYLSNIVLATPSDVPVTPDSCIARAVTSPITARLGGGTDYTERTVDGTQITKNDITALLSARGLTNSNSLYATYIASLADVSSNLELLYNQQVLYSRVIACVDELTDPICYDWDALFCAIADDQYIPKSYISQQDPANIKYAVSDLTVKLGVVAANSKCGVAFYGLPFNCPRGTLVNKVGTWAVKYKDDVSAALEQAGTMYSTYAQLVGPWCKTTLPLGGPNIWVTPELAHLLLIINAQGIGGINKWWMVPAGMTSTGVAHTPEYKIKKAYLDIIQNHDEGVCLNPLMEVPGKGFTCFGNSTLWNKPIGTYNALQNLSTRLLCNRVKQRIWDVALQILFKYNNDNAYSHFYAGLSPLLDEMRSVGALTGNEANPLGYKILMNPDIINLDRINANTVIGKVYLAVTGVIDNVAVDLFLLPPTGFMENYD